MRSTTKWNDDRKTHTIVFIDAINRWDQKKPNAIPEKKKKVYEVQWNDAKPETNWLISAEFYT